MNNSSQKKFTNDDNFNDLSQTTATQATVMRTPVTYNNQPNNNVTISPDHNHQQYDASNNIPHYNYQQTLINVASNNNVTISPDYNHQQHARFK